MMLPVISVAARVTAIAADGCRIEVAAAAGCGSCSRSGSCGSVSSAATQPVLLSRLVSDSTLFGNGVAVAVEIPAALLSKFATLSYLLPAVLLCVGATLGAACVDSAGDLPAIAGAAVGLLLGWATLRLYDSRSGGSRWVGESGGSGLRIGFFQRRF